MRRRPPGRLCPGPILRGRAARINSGHLLVDGAVRHLVRQGVLLPRDVLELVGVEAAQQSQRLSMERLEARVPHRVLALQLTNEQLRVGAHLDLPVAELLGVLEAEQETLVLGEVVRLLSQEPAEASHDVAGRVDEHRARAGGPRVAPRCSVRVDDDGVSGRRLPRLRRRPLLLQLPGRPAEQLFRRLPSQPLQGRAGLLQGLVLGDREQKLRGRDDHLGACRRTGFVGGVDEAVAVRTAHDLGAGQKIVRHLGRDVPLATLAGPCHYRHHGHSTTLLADALVLAHQGAIAELDQPLPFHLQHRHPPLHAVQDALDLRPLTRDHRFLFRQRLLRGLHLLTDVAVFARQPLDLLIRGLVGLLRDVQLARERRVFARRLQLVEARLPLAHLVLLELQQLFVLAPGALVVREPATGGVEVRLGLVALGLDLPQAGRVLLGLDGKIANLEIDLLQLFQRLQLLSRQRSPPSGACFFAPVPRDVNACERALPPAHMDWARQESNLHATGYEPDALTVELRAREKQIDYPGWWRAPTMKAILRRCGRSPCWSPWPRPSCSPTSSISLAKAAVIRVSLRRWSCGRREATSTRPSDTSAAA